MLRHATKFSRYRQLELQLLLRPLNQYIITKSYSSNSGGSNNKRGGFGFTKAIGTVVLLTGATLSYAKYDSEFREWLNKQIPYSSDTINVLFQEDKTLKESFSDIIISTQNWFYNLIPSGAPTQISVPPMVGVELVPYTVAEVDKPKSTKQDSQNANVVSPQKLIEIEDEISKSVALSVENYNKAINAVRDLARYIQQLESTHFDRSSSDLWPTIKDKAKVRNELVNAAVKNSKIAENKMMELDLLLANGDLKPPQGALEQIQLNMKRMKRDIQNACEKLYEEVATGALWSQVQEARHHWGDELGMLFPGLDLEEKNLNIVADEISQFVLHSYFNVLYHQKELSKLELSGEKQLREAMDKARNSGDSSELVKAAVEEELKLQRRQLDSAYQKEAMKLRAACNLEIRKQLRLQTEIASDHLRDALKVKDLELERNHRRELNEALTEENIKYQLMLAGLVGRIKGIDEGLKSHAQLDKSAQEAQDLWTACQIFYRNLQSGTGQIRPLDAEVTAILKTANPSDKLVDIVVKGIPIEAYKRGIYPVNVLRERFLKVEKVARSLALMPGEESSLLTYFVSWLQGALIWEGVEQISMEELQDRPTAHTTLNNYEVLSRARYWVDRGDFSQALKYMNLLEGASKNIASDWMNEVRIYLESMQAATVLLTHAASRGLMYT